MVQRTSYPAGMPCWTDLQAGDVAAAKEFYQRLFGWAYDDRPTPTGAGYALALVDSDVVAAIAPRSPMQPADAAAVWSSYLAVDSVDAAVTDRTGPDSGRHLGDPARPAGRCLRGAAGHRPSEPYSWQRLRLVLIWTIC